MSDRKQLVSALIILAIIALAAWWSYRPLPNIGEGCFAMLGAVHCW